MKLSPQQINLLQSLRKEKAPKSIKEISQTLEIVPNSVYRLIKPLVELGVVREMENHPKKYVAISDQDSLGLFLMKQSEWFHNLFSKNTLNNQKSNNAKFLPEEISLSFVQGRDQLMDRSVEEIDKCKHTVDLLRSGHEMPSEVVRSIRDAISRKVRVRMLIQEFDGNNKNLVRNWKKNGIEVRQVSFQKLRLMIFDSKVLYFMSYKHGDSRNDLGVKIDYQPFSTMLQQYFDQTWKSAIKIDS